MAHDVFISYSSHDKPVADGICAGLESAGIRCWIAPRDCVEGEDWPTQIAGAIGGATVMVLVFSQNANMSDEVSRELYLAANNRLAIIPFVIEQVVPEAGKAYYMGRTHWMDAMNPPTKEQIAKLTKRVRRLVDRVAVEGRVASVLAPVVPPYFRKSLNRRFGWVIPLAELVLAGVLIFASATVVTRVVASTSAATPTPSPAAATPAPTPTPASIAAYWYREDFQRAPFDGALPPQIRPNPGSCDNITLQQKEGSLAFDAPAGQAWACAVLAGSEHSVAQVDAFEATLRSSTSTPPDHPSFEFTINANVPDQKPLTISCGLASESDASGCSVREDGAVVYHTQQFVETPGTAYDFRIEVVDPDAMSFRFVVNDRVVGDYAMAAADAAIYRGCRFFTMFGLNATTPTRERGSFFVDIVAVQQRQAAE